MDHRTYLKEGTVLAFPEMPCRIEQTAGMGANAIVYVGSYPDRHQPDLRHKVLIKELFPYNPKHPAFRNGQGDICFDKNAAEVMKLHRMSFERGNEVHIRMHGSHPGDVDFHMNTYSLHRTLYSVLGFSGGRSMDKELGVPGAGSIALAVHVRRLLGALDVLEAFHASGYLHLDISPDNILLIGSGKKERVSLIDYNSVHTVEEIRNGMAVYYSEKDGYTPREIRLRQRTQIGFHSDLYALSAVFYRCLMGQRLSKMQMVRPNLPDIAGAKCLEGMPDTVLDMARHILKKGLSTVIGRRYPEVGAMREDLEELLDRIDGKGITHWALWEIGRSGVRKIIGANPALEYIKDEEKLYPMAGTWKDGSTVTLPELFERLSSSDGGSAVLLGGGGIGKTTALLRMAYMQQAKYVGTEPAMVYISLYGWNDSGGHYVKNKILQNLKFKPQTDSMETARHELLRLLSSKLRTRRGERPKLILLLDGLNEASGDLTPLLGEIAELSGMAGVRILLAGRNELAKLSFSGVTLRLLEKEEVLAVLSQNGLVPPENEDMLGLLRTPMLLSVFVKTALGSERQLFAETKEQLFAGYLSALLEKEVRQFPQDAPMRFQIEAALYYVLPELAYQFGAKKKALCDRELFPIVKKCYERLKKRYMAAVFPQWIGHIAEIRGDTEDAEKWYGHLVHGILFRKMGLIIRDGQGCYRASHQMIEDYMTAIRQSNRKRIVRKEIQSRFLVAVACLLAVGGLFCRFYDKSSQIGIEERAVYDRKKSESVLDRAVAAYVSVGRQYEDIGKVLECLGEEPVKKADYQRYLENCKKSLQKDVDAAVQDTDFYIGSLLATGEVMPWSKEALDTSRYEKLVLLPAKSAKVYLQCMENLDLYQENQALWEELGAEFLAEFQNVLECNARVAGGYYTVVLEPEFAAMEESGLQDDRLYLDLCMKSIVPNEKQEKIQNEVAENFRERDIIQYESRNNKALENLTQKTAYFAQKSTGR